MSDEYKVTQNSDGSYNVREVTSWIESSAGQRLIDGWAKILSAGSDPAQERAAKAEAERFYKMQEYWDNIPDDKKILYRKRWMELSGVNAYKDDIGKVYGGLKDCHIEVPDYVKKCSHDAFLYPGESDRWSYKATEKEYKPINFDSKPEDLFMYDDNHTVYPIDAYKVEGVKKRLNVGIFFLVLSAILLLLSAFGSLFMPADGCITTATFGLLFAIIGPILFFPARKEIKKIFKALKNLQNYGNTDLGTPIPAKDIADNCSQPEAFKWFVYNEVNIEEYRKFFSTQWTKDNLPPLLKNDVDKAALYAWEKRRRVEDKEYFDCVTNTEWARKNPDPSIYSYCKAISGHYPDGIKNLFSIYYDHVTNQVVRDKKMDLDPARLYLKYYPTEEWYNWFINFVNQKFSLYGIRPTDSQKFLFEKKRLDKYDRAHLHEIYEYHNIYETLFSSTKFKLTDLKKINLHYFKFSYFDNKRWPPLLPFTCGDLYGHLQWLKRRLAEDKEFVQMLPNLKYSPFLYILLSDFTQISQDEELYKKDYATASVGLDLQWYIAQDFQKILCENLRKHSAELDSILPFDDSGLDNFDLNAAVNKL